MSAAVSPSSAEARIATPHSENLKTAKKAAMSTAATPMATRRFVVMPTSPKRTTPPAHGCGTLRMSEPIRRVISVTSTMSTPMVRMARLITAAPRSRLMSSRSVSSATTAVARMPSASPGQKPRRSLNVAIM